MSVTVSGSGSISVSVSGGVGPAIVVSGTSTAVVGTLGVNPFAAGANITITTTGGSYTIIGANPPVYSVQGMTGTVVLQAATIGAASASHLHSTANITGITALIQSYGNVLSVQGRTGVVSLSVADFSAAASTHTHSTTSISGFTAAIVSLSPVASVNGQTGAITISAVPSQSGNAGKYLQTDGTSASWSTVQTIPSQGSQNGKFLQTNGSSLLWSSIPSGTGVEENPFGGNIALTSGSRKYQIVDPGNSNSTVTLPSAAVVGSAYEYTIRRTGSGTGDVIVEDNASNTLATLTGSQWANFANDGTNWFKVANA